MASRGSHRWTRLAAAVALAMVAALPRIALAQPDVDIRSADVLSPFATSATYVVRLSDCSSVAAIDLANGFPPTTVASSEAELSPSDGSCELSFAATGSGLLTPSLEVVANDGLRTSYQEVFAVESNPPIIELGEVRFLDVGGAQHLAVTATAVDDVDISRVSLSIVGLRASVLRNAGGIIEKARTQAFADTGGFVQVVPGTDNQVTFEISLPVVPPLTAAEIASNGVVLAEGRVIDASGNHGSFSRLVFTGSDVSERALALSASPSEIVFTSLLESATITPIVDFEFRGPTRLTGLSSQVTFASSHPALIAVTRSGTVFPLADTGATPVSIQAVYPGLPPVDISVEMDSARSLVGLRAEGVDAQGRFILPSLNSYYPLPELVGVFDDGSEAPVGSQFPVLYSLVGDAQGLLELNEDRMIALAAIAETAPVTLHIELEGIASVALDLPVAALDAPPEVNLDAYSHVRVGDTIVIAADVTDDVEVDRVEFFLDDQLIGTREGEPFEVVLDADPSMLNQTFSVRAEAVDSSGQRSVSPTASISIISNDSGNVPLPSFESPAALQRFVERAPIRYQVALPLGDTPERSLISQVEFEVDGRSVGVSRYPILENRPGDEGPDYFEVWYLDSVVEEVSTAETTRAVQAVVWGPGSQPAIVPPLLFVIVQEIGLRPRRSSARSTARTSAWGRSCRSTSSFPMTRSTRAPRPSFC